MKPGADDDPHDRGPSGRIVVVAKDQLSCDLAGEAVILDMKTGTYFSLNEVGARVWSLIQEPRSVRDIQAIILREYEVGPGRCGDDLEELLRDLMAAGLIEARDGATA